MLDAVQVHRDGRDVTGEQRVRAVRRDADVLGDIGAVERERVGSGAAVDSVAAIARVPQERIVAGAEEGNVVAAAADHDVVAIAADEYVVAGASGDAVVPGAAIDGQLHHACGERGRGDRVVAVHALDDECVVGTFCVGDGDSGREPGDGHRGPGAGDLDGVGPVGAFH